MYPFSLSTVLYCIKRLLQRKEHSTLTCADEVKAVHVLVFFLKLYQNFFPKPNYLKEQGVSGLIEIPFTPTLESIPSDLISAFLKVLDNTRISVLLTRLELKGGDSAVPDLIKELIALITKYSDLFAKEADVEANAALILSDLCKYAANSPEEVKQPVPLSVTTGKLPIYLGIEISTPRKDILQLALQGCKEIEKSAALDSKDELKDLIKFIEEDKTGGWKYPNSHHVTALFIGGNSSLAESKIYNEFEEGKKQEVKLGAIVMVPHKIVFAICFVKAEIGNKIPHLTLLINHCAPKISNSFGEALFLGVPELKEKYEAKFFENDGEAYINQHVVTVEGWKFNAYVYKPKQVIVMYGINRKFY